MTAAKQDAPDLAHVLIVEDEEPLAETVAFIVKRAGYCPVVTLNGRQALEVARNERPALVITDLMLLYLDGAALIATLRSDARSRGELAPPIILMTAANPAIARAAGADVLLRKPFQLAELEQLLHRFLGPTLNAKQ